MLIGAEDKGRGDHYVTFISGRKTIGGEGSRKRKSLRIFSQP